MKPFESNNPDLDRYAVRAILEYAAANGVAITYGLMADKIGDMRGRKMSNQGISDSLGRIQESCEKLNLPILSAMAVSRHLKVGEGFFMSSTSYSQTTTGAMRKSFMMNKGECSSARIGKNCMTIWE